MGPRPLWRDLRSMGRGIGAFVRYLRSQETIDIALGSFEATSSTVVMGQPCAYVIRVANLRREARQVRVTLEILPHSVASPAAQPAARVAKDCTIPPSGAIVVEFHYDWQATATVMIDHVASVPDACWAGEMKARQRYVVRAVISDLSGQRLDALKIYQELTG